MQNDFIGHHHFTVGTCISPVGFQKQEQQHGLQDLLAADQGYLQKQPG